MILSAIYVIFAILGLSFLIFIHELGHYWMARRVGMRVETFAIGFGKPIYSWMRKGVKWQIGWLPFGGYVKIAGTETDERTDPYQIPDGFFGKKPLDRIKVAFMGPFVNLLFAFILFSLLWFSGGREKSFSELTKKIGWVDPHSELYAAGIRPGDEITDYHDYPFQSFKDHLYAPMIAGAGEIEVKGVKIDYKAGEKVPFDDIVEAYSHPHFYDKNILTAGVLQSASYVIYDRLPGGVENPLSAGSPLQNSGIQYGDRILWVDGELVFSNEQLSELLNDGRVLVTIDRGGELLLRRIPRVLVQELRPDPEFREEMIDWQYEAGIQEQGFHNIYAIPYNITYDGVIENVLRFVDKESQEEAFPVQLYSELEEPLNPGDKIAAVQGIPVSFSYDILRELQGKTVNIIVQRRGRHITETPPSSKEADASFNQHIDWDQLEIMAKSIGTNRRITSLGDLHLLNPVVPTMRSDFAVTEEAQAWQAAENLERKREIEQEEDPEKRAYLLNFFENRENRLILGLPSPQDKKVIYNPKPTTLFSNVIHEIWSTLQALFSGSISPKYITGPVGIVHVVHTTSMVSIKEAVFWIGAISLNLGILNLLPIPILDGGTILLSFFEMVTGKRVKPKTLEKVVVFFAILLIAFFLFLTYNDIVRVFGNFLN
ncbi:MAG: site-2 protease family protein [Waddliaceae bacterium]